jgi:hypothetical protein
MAPHLPNSGIVKLIRLNRVLVVLREFLGTIKAEVITHLCLFAHKSEIAHWLTDNRPSNNARHFPSPNLHIHYHL